MSYKDTQVLEQARIARDQAVAYFDHCVTSGDLDMICGAISQCQNTEEKFLIAQREITAKELRRRSEDLDNTVLKDAEGKRKFIVNQFNGLTGHNIK